MIGVVLTIVLAITPAALDDQVVTLTLVTAPSSGQDPGQDPAKPAPVSALPVAQEAAPMKITSASAPMTNDERQTFREGMSNMESLLANAVSNGARRLLLDNPGMTLVPAGPPRARGFALDGYGLFFDVEIPELNGSIALTLLMQRELQRRLDEQNTNQQGPARRATQIAPPSDDPDPSTPYREAVITAVTNVMLDYSKSLNVQPTEWMTVGLRGSDVSQQQGFSDAKTLVLRIKGSDLADFLASRISKEEALRRVEKREF